MKKLNFIDKKQQFKGILDQMRHQVSLKTQIAQKLTPQSAFNTMDNSLYVKRFGMDNND